MCLIVSFRLNFYSGNINILVDMGEFFINFENKNNRIFYCILNIVIILFEMTIVLYVIIFLLFIK